MSKESRESQTPGRWRSRLLWGLAVFLAAAVWGLFLWRALAPPKRFHFHATMSQDLVYCDGGSMRPLSRPHELVQVEPFYVDRFEVSCLEYAEFLAAHPEHKPPLSWGTRRAPAPQFTDLPVVWVSLNDARAYAEWRNKRIPTSEEWEWAALGASEGRYPWGAFASTLKANTLELGLLRRTPQGLFPEGASPWGALDMVGNVREWTETLAEGRDRRYFLRGGSYGESLEGAGQGNVMMTHSPAHVSSMTEIRDPTTGELVTRPVTREELIPISVHLAAEDKRSSQWGFRCVMDVAEYERQRQELEEIQEAIRALGARDPITWFLETRPAVNRLQAAGDIAKHHLVQALKSRPPDAVRERIEALLSGWPR